MRKRRSWCRHYGRATVADKRAAGAASSSPGMLFEGSRTQGEIVRMVFWRSRSEKKAEAPIAVEAEKAAPAAAKTDER